MFGEFLSTIHTWLQPHSMPFESVDKMKWENYLFKWTPTQQQAFEQIKNKLCTAPVLVLPDLHQPFEIETDASDHALSAVITQLGHPVSFNSEIFNDIVRRYSTYEK